MGFRTNWGPTHLVVSDDRRTFGKILPPKEDVIEPSVAGKSLFETTELIVKPLSSTLLSYPGLQLESAHKLPPGISLRRRDVEKVQCYCKCFSPQAPWWIILNFSWKGLSDGCSIVDPALVKIPMIALCRLKACGCVQEYVPYRPPRKMSFSILLDAKKEGWDAPFPFPSLLRTPFAYLDLSLE